MVLTWEITQTKTQTVLSFVDHFFSICNGDMDVFFLFNLLAIFALTSANLSEEKKRKYIFKETLPNSITLMYV